MGGNENRRKLVERAAGKGIFPGKQTLDSPQPIVVQDCDCGGRPFGRGDGRFCSSRCREAYDTGTFAPYDPHYPRRLTALAEKCAKSGFWTIPPKAKKRRKYARKIRDLRRHFSKPSVATKPALDDRWR